ncbi:MAG TPA: hypothetical protein VK845_17195 [Gemmatimonadales bacterium]|nr:hypothetical protein [Gemmatimonadales bacterium]
MTASAVPAGGAHAIRPARSADAVVTAGEVAAFALGTVTWLEIQFLGRMYLGELGLAVCAIALPVLWRRVRRDGAGRRVLAWYIALFAIYFVGLILTDLYRGSGFTDFARGWARALFLFTNTIGLLVIGYDRPRQLVAWIGGQAVSGLLVVALGYVQYGMILWKFGLALPVTVGLLVLTDSRRSTWALLVLLALGALNLLLDYRSVAGFCCVAALLLYYKSKRDRGARLRAVFATGLVTTAIGAGFLALYSSGALLGDPTFGRDIVERRRDSNIERLAGLVIGVQAVRASPIVGYGSWARSSELFDNWAVIQEEMGSTVTAAGRALGREERGELDVIPTHSQVLQGWVEAGIPGVAFFVFLLVALIVLLRVLIRRPGIDRVFALTAFWAVSTIWAVAMSPFSGLVRLHDAMAFALLFVLSTGSARGLRASRPPTAPAV